MGIRVRKSGKMEFVIGDYVLDMDFASPMDCYQQVLHLHLQQKQNGAEGSAQFLGEVPAQKRLVCSYKVQDLIEMLSAVKTEEVKKDNEKQTSMKEVNILKLLVDVVLVQCFCLLCV